MRYAFAWSMLLVSGFGIHVAQAQREPGGSLPLPPITAPSGQDLSSSLWERPPRLHPPEPIEADRLRRAERQAQYFQAYPGTPSRALYAALPGDRNRAVQ